MKKILIVDDQVEVRELMEVTLRYGHYKILQASNGEEAISITKKEKPELVIMDIMMPGEIDGFEATRLIKSDPQTKTCKIIMLTAKGQDADKDKAEELGIEAYFVKPFSPLDLINKIEEILG